jgi:hypothetical protein
VPCKVHAMCALSRGWLLDRRQGSKLWSARAKERQMEDMLCGLPSMSPWRQPHSAATAPLLWRGRGEPPRAAESTPVRTREGAAGTRDPSARAATPEGHPSGGVAEPAATGATFASVASGRRRTSMFSPMDLSSNLQVISWRPASAVKSRAVRPSCRLMHATRVGSGWENSMHD